MKKIILALVVFSVFLVFSNYFKKGSVTTNNDGTTRTERIASVLSAKFDEFGLANFRIIDSDTDPTIWIEMDKNESEQELREYLLKNISKSDLNHYNIEISKKSLQEVQKEHSSILKESEFKYLSSFLNLGVCLVEGYKPKDKLR